MPRKRVESWITEEIRAWAEERPWCAVCHAPVERAWPSPSIHHLVFRSKRRCDEIFNLILLGHECHEGGVHGLRRPGFPSLTFGQLLYAKIENDPANWNPDALEEIYGRRLPHVMPLPQEYLNERKLHRRYGA